MGSWNTALNTTKGDRLSLILETDMFPMSPPPTPNEIQKILNKFKNGKAPGNDRITMEMLKGLPDSALYHTGLMDIQ